MKLKIVTSGAYSDYMVHAVVDWTSHEEPTAALERYLSASPDQREAYKFNEDEFLAWVLAEKLAVELECGELYLGAYSSVESFKDGAIGGEEISVA